MKLLVILFATVLVAQLANASAVGSSPNDGVEEYQDFQYMDNSNKVSEDIQTRACNNETCNNHCRRLGFKVGRCVSANVCRCNK